MKPLYMTQEIEEEMLKKFFEKFQKEWETFKENMNDTKFTFSQEFAEKAKEKITLIFTQQAYLRMKSLVDFFDTEVGWYGLVERLDQKTFRIYDVRVCKQYVSGAKVDTEDADTLEFFNSLSDDEAEHMHFQAHSHVRMDTFPSGTDSQNQADVIKNMGKKGFYIFQIWNKQGSINSFVYDLDNNMFYDKNDIDVDIEDETGTMLDYVASVADLVQEKKYPYTYTPTTYPKGNYSGNEYYSSGYGKRNYYSSGGYYTGNGYNYATQSKKNKKEEVPESPESILSIVKNALDEGWYDERWDY